MLFNYSYLKFLFILLFVIVFNHLTIGIPSFGFGFNSFVIVCKK